MTPLKSPFPYFGAKSAVASEVWSRFGNVTNVIEPFFGSGAILLARPRPFAGVETVNDLDGWLTNFWRAVQHAPDQVAAFADYPVSELDLHARGNWLFYRDGVVENFVERLRADPDYYDAKSAGWWVWGQSAWIAGGWGRNENKIRRAVGRKLPLLSNAGAGVHRVGVKRQRPILTNNSGVNAKDHAELYNLMRALSERLRHVRICCGDWKRVCDSPTTTTAHGLTAIFLDPPYSHAVRDKSLYNVETDCATEVRAWAIAHGDDPLMRIALCGYRDEHDAEIPASWERLAWHTGGGYANIGNGRGKLNRKNEVIWFSPHCLKTRLI